MKRELLVGLVFFCMLGLLLGVTLWVNDPGFLGPEAPFKMTARFREVSGLKRGDEVWVYGTKAGRVIDIQPDGKGAVEVQLGIDYDPQLRADHEVKLRPSSALGGMVVAIHPGTSEAPPFKGGIVDGANIGDPLGQLGDMVAEIREPLTAAVTSIEKISRDLAARSEQVSANIDGFTENARVLTDDLRAGKGTLGKLLNDDSLHDDLRAAIKEIQKIGTAVNEGEGTIAMLLHDPEFATDLRASAKSLRETSGMLERGEGTLGKLLHDPKLYDDLSATAAELRTIATDARTGNGLLAKLIYDDELGARMDQVTADVAQITGKLRRGEGTLGKLIQDDAVYRELEGTLSELRKGTGQARENAPLLTFAGLLFGSF